MSGRGESSHWEQGSPQEIPSNTGRSSSGDPINFMRQWQQEGSERARLRATAAPPQIMGPNETGFHETEEAVSSQSGRGEALLRQALDRHQEALNAPTPQYQSEQPFPRAPGPFGSYIRGEQVRLSKVDIYQKLT